MCLIAFAWQADPRYRLVVAANRDELHSRPTAAAAFWDDAPGLYAGRDLKDGGTWMGVTRTGRFAALTNYRDPGEYKPGAPSRGQLVANFLRELTSPAQYSEGLAATQYLYNSFNLLAGDDRSLWYVGNRAGPPHEVEPGLHGLSNALLDTPWPKTAQMRSALGEALAAQGDSAALIEALFAALADRTPAPDELLPHTGVGLERERQISPRMIVAPLYGTRSASVLLVGHDGRIEMAERSFDPAAAVTGEVRRIIES
jgi:uncharacterized protein with NRDE domain